jgi:type IV pilus assembly protein PilA
MSTLTAPFSLKNDKGFSLVELMIVVAIIGVLSALAVPKFQSFQAKAKQSEAKSNLSHIYTLEQSFYGDQDKYSASLKDIGFSLQGRVRYGYAVVAPTTSTFTATATASTVVLDVSGNITSATPNNTNISSNCTFPDKWTINQNKELYLAADCVTNNPTKNLRM